MRIMKSKDCRIKIGLLYFFGIMFLTLLAYFFGFRFEWDSFLICILIILAEFILVFIICFLLIKFEKQYYIIDKDGVRLYKRDKLLFELRREDIIRANYIRFRWAFAMQLGSGYLNLTYPCDNLKDKKFSLIFPDGKAIHSISMSMKQARKAAELLIKRLEVQ